MEDAQEPLIGADDLATPEWAEGYEEVAKAGFLTLARRTPAVVAALVRFAWEASPPLTVLTGVTQLLTGVVQAFGLLATADVFSGLLTDGPTPDRLLAALPALLTVVGAHVLAGGLQAAVGWLTAALVPRIERRTKDDLYAALIAVDLVAFDDADLMQLVQRSTGMAPLRIREGVRVAGDLLASAIGIGSALVAVGVLHPVLVPAVLLAAVPHGWATVRSAQLAFGSFVRMASRTRRGDVTGALISERQPAAEVRAFTTQDRLLAEHRRIADELTDESVRLGTRQNHFATAGRLFGGFGLGLAYLALILLLWSGGLALPLAGTAVIAMRTATTSITSAVYAANQLVDSGFYVDIHAQCLRRLRAARRRTGTVPLPGDPSVIAFRGAGFRYPGADADALTDVTLTLRRGEVVALVGENGSGKSTLAKLLTGLYLPTAGEVTWDGVRTDLVDARDLHERVAVVMQDPVRWPMTAENNVRIGRLPRPDPDGAVFADATRRSGADTVLAGLPSGPATVLSRAFQEGRDLSGGQWQRISVARGLYRDAPVVVADEPTAAMDARAEHAVFRALQTMGGHTRITVLVTHRLANVRHADRIVVLEHGRITETGTHAELMANRGTYHELFSLQADAYLPDAAPAGAAEVPSGP